ncbi:MAG: hypothetical protein H7Y17_15160 [Chlorobia bacterium]|nr:hypothetical protein [Fimbriimonadaceae bacterium]
MRKEISGEHPIWMYFGQAVHQAMVDSFGMTDEDVEVYLTGMLVEFLHHDHLYAIRDRAGRPVDSIAEMLMEGDIRYNAPSFDREREVHRHIGDFLLFSSGLFPEVLRDLKLRDSRDLLLDVNEQARESYHIASTFDHAPYTADAKTLKKLSTQFEAYQASLMLVRASLGGPGGWGGGFEA